MLPERHRLSHRKDFSSVMRGGRRCGRHDVVVHINALPRFVDSAALSAGGEAADRHLVKTGPRVGLIVSTAVGNAVVRHRVARRLRHVACTVLGDLDPGIDIVLRALPGAATATSAELRQQIESALLKLRVREPRS
ncbi:ribonuclease P protein component [Tomitella biformata]|uniref:ribonuclease P protein component n=1 Tax=Tomitella biformata TaxID=630403 RepID=UPI00046354D8|nr:ribonuclease P protein component [Tomitella biformata]